MMFWYGEHWDFWQTSMMWVLMILFWGLLIWAVYALITTAIRKPPRSGNDSARDILDRRLVRGEIDEAEYRRLRGLMSASVHDDRTDSGSPR